MSDTKQNTSPLGEFLVKNKEKIFVGLIFYLLGVNQQMKSQLSTITTERDGIRHEYNKHRDDEVMAANRLAFRKMLLSDSTYFVGPDSVYLVPEFKRDSTK